MVVRVNDENGTVIGRVRLVMPDARIVRVDDDEHDEESGTMALAQESGVDHADPCSILMRREADGHIDRFDDPVVSFASREPALFHLDGEPVHLYDGRYDGRLIRDHVFDEILCCLDHQEPFDDLDTPRVRVRHDMKVAGKHVTAKECYAHPTLHARNQLAMENHKVPVPADLRAREHPDFETRRLRIEGRHERLVNDRHRRRAARDKERYKYLS